MPFNANKIRMIAKNNKILAFKNELEYISMSPLSISEERVDALKKLIQLYNEGGSNEVDDSSNIINNVKQALYHREWNKLHDMHKLELLSTFITSNFEIELHKSLISLCEKGIDDGLFNSKTSVDYDKESASIIKINILQNNNNKFTLNDKPKKKTTKKTN
jgi:hypothetical protein